MASSTDHDRAAETLHQVYAICGMARLVSVDDVRNAVNSISYMDSVLPILDPTAYRDLIASSNNDGNRELLAAFSTFRHAIEKVAERFPEQMKAEVS